MILNKTLDVRKAVSIAEKALKHECYDELDHETMVTLLLATKKYLENKEIFLIAEEETGNPRIFKKFAPVMKLFFLISFILGGLLMLLFPSAKKLEEERSIKNFWISSRLFKLAYPFRQTEWSKNWTKLAHQ